MKIGINATYLEKSCKTGVERYAESVIKTLINANLKEEIHLFSQYNLHIRPSNNIYIHISPFVKGWHTLRLPLELHLNPVDIFLEPGYSVPPFTSIPTVVVVHDLAYRFFPQAYSKKQLNHFDNVFNNIANKSKGVVFISNSTKQDFEHFYPDCKALKQTIYLGARNISCSSGLSSNNRLALPQKYILSVGRLEIRKNTLNLIRAYKILRQNQTNFNHKLVLVGSKGVGYDLIKKEINSDKFIKKDIIETGYLDDSKLHDMYRKADLFVFPSLYEGFGLPILEAFKHQIPTIVSKTSSMPEVAGKAAFYCDPQDVHDIADKILKLISNTSLQNDLNKQASKQLSKFSWHHHCQELINFLYLCK